MIAFYENRTTDYHCRSILPGRSRIQCAAHLHTHIELVLFLEGHCTAFADTERCEINGGDVFIAFPNQIHRYESYDKERYRLFIINPDILPEIASIFTDSHPTSSKIAGAAKDPEILALAERLAALDSESGPYLEVRRHGYLMALLGRLLSQMVLTKTVPDDSHALKTIVNYCAKNYTSDLSLSLLENELHISRYYISHLFSDKLQIGFNDYVNSLRVSFACNYLRYSDRSVTEISDLVGFGTLRTFNRAFLKQMGRTPSEYRRMKREAHSAEKTQRKESL
ncbi:MAG: AraC family transcriptional regulator [Ruminococcaceae bacterium]|nr:AraC family transcriptional regulator [Oscillospiraceae bacterium]